MSKSKAKSLPAPARKRKLIKPTDRTGPDVTRRRRLAVKGLLAAIIVLCAIVQLAIPPLVGLANNGDFAKLAGQFSLGPGPTPDSGLFHRYYISRLQFHPSFHWESGFTSSALLPISFAVHTSRFAISRDWFDMRFLAMTYVAILAFAAWILFTAADRIPSVGRWTLYLLSVLMFADTGYIAYFSSFFGEPASFVFGLGFIASVLLTIEKPTRASFAGILAFFTLFTLAKPQNAASAILFIPLGFRLVKLLAPLWLRGVFAAGLALAIVSAGLGARALPRKNLIEVTYYASVFSEILKYSPDPQADLRELGVETPLARLAGTSPFDPSIDRDSQELETGFYRRISYLRILRFYLNHPDRLWGVIDRCSKSALLVRPELGNFEQKTGLPPYTQSESFDLWYQFHAKVLPSTGAGLALIFATWLAGAVHLYRRKSTFREKFHIEFFVTLLAMAAAQMLVVAVCHGGFVDTSRHLLLFAMLFDACLVYFLAWLAMRAWPLLKARYAERA